MKQQVNGDENTSIFITIQNNVHPEAKDTENNHEMKKDPEYQSKVELNLN